MTNASERLWRTGDGRLVRDGDQDGVSLAYAQGDEVTAKDAHLVPDAEPTDRVDHEPTQEQPEPKPARAKAAAKPADKQAAKPDDK
jgi:hypothetical protein